jgi:exportin-2 (importin alpha re-exporter)
MSDIPKLLLDSLNPHTRKQAEHSLQAYSRQPAFVNHLLQLILDASNDSAVRLAASVYLKNTVRLGWLEDVCSLEQLIFQYAALTSLKDEYPISLDDKESLKPRLAPAMIALSGPNEKAIRAQVVESLSLIAELDFPERWPDLIDVRQQTCHRSSTFIPILLIATRPIP